MLLENKANTDARNKEGDTPLFVAAKKKHEEIAKMMLNAGAHFSFSSFCHPGQFQCQENAPNSPVLPRGSEGEKLMACSACPYQQLS